MKKSRSLFCISLLALLLAGISCKEEPLKTVNSNTASSAANAPAAPTEPSRPAAGPSLSPPVLFGKYAMSEVRHDGQVSMVSKSNVTEIVFTKTGAYMRESRRGGVIDHNDSGDFRVENNGTIVLRTQMSNGKLKVPPTEKRYEFFLSSGGDELILKGSEGREAVFRRQ